VKSTLVITTFDIEAENTKLLESLSSKYCQNWVW